jgi:hypothetical protein
MNSAAGKEKPRRVAAGSTRRGRFFGFSNDPLGS